MTAAYDSTETLDGLETYKYHVLLESTPAEVIDGIQGTYSQDKFIWIEPRTGGIVNQTQHEVRTLESGDTILDLNLAFTEEQVADGVQDAKDNKAQLDLVTGTLPLVGFIGGILALLAGAFLVFAEPQGREGLSATPHDSSNRSDPARGPACRHFPVRRAAGLPGWPRRSPSRGSAARGCATTRPRRGRGRPATRARPGR